LSLRHIVNEAALNISEDPHFGTFDDMTNVTNLLTHEQCEQFHRDGFLILKNILPQADVQPLIDELSQWVEDGTKAATSAGILEIGQQFQDAPFSTRLSQVSTACSEPDWIWQNYFRNQKPRTAGMFILRTSPPLLDAVESLIGPEIFAHPQFNFRAKLPEHQLTVIPWHQDLAYLISEEAGETLVVNAWIPLVQANKENGCMQIIRGSHKFSLLPHSRQDFTVGHTGNIGIAEADLPDGEVVTAGLDIGDILLTTERLVHRGLPNRSNTVRWSIDTRYNRIGLPTGREQVPGFIARSRVDPTSITNSHQQWDHAFETV
jgi:hypothetical protein